MDLVSIIVPVYNSEKYINRCMDSLINQTYKNIEIIAIDDGSKDNSLEILNQYATKDKRIKVFYQINQGPSVARNTGLDKSSGSYVMFVDIDDYIDLDMARLLITDIDEKKSTLVLCDNSEVWLDKIDKRKILDDNNANVSKSKVIKLIASGRAGLVCGKLFSKNIIEKYNIRFDKNVKMCEDQIFFLNISIHCKKFIYVPKSLYYYDRRNENSITVKYQKNAIDNQIYVINNIKEILNKSDLDNDEINLIINNRYMSAINYCISNEILDMKISNIKSKISNIRYIIQNNKSKEDVENILPSNIRERIIIKAFKRNSYVTLASKYYALDRIISPLKRKIRKSINT
ncbi:Undecaprenyl-phosphate 4-deoxy-4-formamido-L-arabinose transferase [bioreactor metagenome]|uniref:Undecaprenyl-phosphate 4-deoxy-4-formamido-L-arabinose transferase n=1 Tax=bioreactor metagenome TaxID=1076179 RepID=A0A645BMD4_9ZZZZ